MDPGTAGRLCQQQLTDFPYISSFFLFLSLFFPFLFTTSFFWFSCLFSSFSFVFSFIFPLSRFLFRVKITACATNSHFNRGFQEICCKMNPRKTLFVKYSIPKIKRYLLKNESEKKYLIAQNSKLASVL